MPTRPPRTRDVLLLAIAAGMAACLALSLPFVLAGLPLAALAIGWVVHGAGGRSGWAAVAVATLAGALAWAGFAAAAGASPAGALFEGALSLAVIVPLLVAVRMGARLLATLSPWTVATILATAALAGTTLMWGIVMATPEGRGEAASVASQVVDQVAEQPYVQTVDGPITDEDRRLARTLVLSIAPAALLATYALAGVFGVAALARAASRSGVPARRLPALRDLDVSLHVSWFVTAGLALVAIGSFTGRTGGWETIVGGNLLVASGAVLFAQGLGVTSFFLTRLGLSGPLRIMAFVLLVLLVNVPLLVASVGLGDLWLNFRHLPRDDKPVPPRPLEREAGGL